MKGRIEPTAYTTVVTKFEPSLCRTQEDFFIVYIIYSFYKGVWHSLPRAISQRTVHVPQSVSESGFLFRNILLLSGSEAYCSSELQPKNLSEKRYHMCVSWT